MVRLSSFHRPSVALALALLAAACSATNPQSSAGAGGGNTGGSASGQTLTILPADAVLGLPDGNPTSLAFKATLSAPDSEQDVTGEAVFTLEDGALGAFDGATFNASGDTGKTVVHASARGREATTTLTIRDEKIIIAQGAPADAPALFDGPVDAGLAPSIVYPGEGVMVPPNMNVLEFHFMPGAGNTLFELSFELPSLDVKVYLPCSPVGAGCAFTPDKAAWKLVSDAAKGKDAVPYKIRGVNGQNPQGVGVSAPQAISFGLEDIVGGLYYWNAGAGTTMRYEFGVTGQLAELYMNAQTAGAGVCVGCHVLSRDGKKIALGLDIPAPAPYKVFDVATKGEIYQQGTPFGGGSNFFTFSPDTKQMMTSNGLSIVLRDSATGVAITDPLVANGAMPDWAPDGKKMVYSSPGIAPPCIGGFCGAPGVDSGSLAILPFDGTAWGAPIPLVPFQGQNNFYPAFSPDANWVIFNRSASNANSFDASDARVWAVPAAGGNPIQLAIASTGGDSWPKWTPDVQIYKSGALLWFTFSSRRAYGLRLSGGSTSQIWMAAFDPNKAKMGQDPSTTAFWLPFQDLGSGNHIAQWVTKVERQPCFDISECGANEICEDGLCIPVIK